MHLTRVKRLLFFLSYRMLSMALCVIMPLSLLWSRYYSYPHFTDEEIKLKGVRFCAQSLRTRRAARVCSTPLICSELLVPLLHQAGYSLTPNSFLHCHCRPCIPAKSHSPLHAPSSLYPLSHSCPSLSNPLCPASSPSPCGTWGCTGVRAIRDYIQALLCCSGQVS